MLGRFKATFLEVGVMWFFSRKVKMPADALADLLLSEIVENEADGLERDMEHDLELTSQQKQAYHSKCKLYRLAMVLVAVVAEQSRTPGALRLQESIEHQVFGQRNVESERVLVEVNGAMSDVQRLLQSGAHKEELSWAMSWLSEIGVDRFNPADLLMVSAGWMIEYSCIVKSLRGFKIQ